ncbi:MAG: hypothetical protein STSR0008_26110 [Ignavibacterium sp.]
MAKKNQKARERVNIKQKQVQKQKEKKYLVHPKYKSFVSTVIIILILLIFFIVNNTRKEPERGPYPPLYKQNQTSSYNE